MSAMGTGSGMMPAPGMRVRTNDGDDLGTVKEVSGASFKVDAPMKKDYWLPSSSIQTQSDGALLLNFGKSRLNDYKRDSPDGAAGTAGAGGSSNNAIDILVAMHRDAKQQFAQILGTMPEAGDGQRAGDLWQKLQPALKVHEQMEETYLYQPLRQQQGAGTELGAWESPSTRAKWTTSRR